MYVHNLPGLPGVDISHILNICKWDDLAGGMKSESPAKQKVCLMQQRANATKQGRVCKKGGVYM